MSMVTKFRKLHGLSNPERFNQDIINLKQKENVLDYLLPICQSLEVIDGLKVKNVSVENFNKIYTFGSKDTFDIEKSELEILKLEFLINDEHVERSFYFPKLIDGQYFIINNNRYFPIPQLIDSGVYRISDAITLKSLLMPMILRERKMKLETTNGEIFKFITLDIDLFKNKIPFFGYFTAKFGYEEAIEFLGVKDIVHILTKEEVDELDKETQEDNYFFGISKKLFLVVDKTYFNENSNHKIIVGSIFSMMNSRIRLEKIYDQNYWIKKLGSFFTTNNSNTEDKGKNIIISFERILDNWIKTILRTKEENKKSSFHIVRAMVNNFSNLYHQNNMNLANKRLRIYEYLLYPLLLKFSKGTYRILNSKNTDKTKSLLNIPPGYIIKSIVQSELIRYDNSVNSINLFNTILRYTSGGPQSPFRKSNSDMRYRGIDESYVNRLSLVSTSAGDPGVSGSLSPFLVLPENMHMHFTELPEIELL